MECAWGDGASVACAGASPHWASSHGVARCGGGIGRAAMASCRLAAGGFAPHDRDIEVNDDEVVARPCLGSNAGMRLAATIGHQGEPHGGRGRHGHHPALCMSQRANGSRSGAMPPLRIPRQAVWMPAGLVGTRTLGDAASATGARKRRSGRRIGLRDPTASACPSPRRSLSVRGWSRRRSPGVRPWVENPRSAE